MAPKTKKSDNFNDFCPTRDNLIKSLEKIKLLIEKNSNSMTIIELETRASLVESIFLQLNNVQMQIEQDKGGHEFSKRQFYEELYCEVKSRIGSLISECNRRNSPCLESTHNISYGATQSSIAIARLANLPKLKVPTFFGKYTEWTNWYNTFSSLIHNDSDLDNLAKFVHLRAALGPIPLRTIESLEVTAENYFHALSLLKTRFENKSIIFQAHVKDLFETPRLTRLSSSNLRELIDKVNSHLRALKSLGNTEEVANVIIYYLIRTKVDTETLKKWEDQVKCDELPSWERFSNFLGNRCNALENRDLHGLFPALDSSDRVATKTTSRNEKTKKSNSFALTASPDKKICPSCKGNHILIDCPSFFKLSPMQRYFEIKKHSLCVLCLIKSHPIKECTAARCSSCNGVHNELLHRGEVRKNRNVGKTEASSQINEPDKFVVESKEKPPDFEVSTYSHSSSLYNSLLSSSTVKFLATAVLLVRDLEGKFIECRAILDSGSQLNFVTSKFAEKINLKIEPAQATISGIGSAKTEALGKVNAIIRSRFTNYSDSLQFLIIPSITKYSPNVETSKWQLPKNIDLADPKFNESRVIDMLLGVSTFFKLLSVGQIALGENMPILQKSLLGWILAGEYKYSSNSNSIVVANSATEEDKKLSELVEKFWKCETIESSCLKFTPEEQDCENFFLQTVQRTLSGRFVVRLPFKTPFIGVGESYSIALKRFERLERKLGVANNANLKIEYKKFIDEYRELDHLECVSHLTQSDLKYFMPHHAVLRPSSLSTKLRVVFDASCKSSNGRSLNDNLLVGPKVQPELFDILVRFRLYKYALSADISKMYRQILVNEEDCNWQCILWRDEKLKKVDILRLKTVTYGTSSAPYLAVRCLQFLADNFKVKYPLGCQVLQKNVYMDDMLAGANTVQELLELKSEVIGLLNLGKFDLHKWRSNLTCSTQPLDSTLVQEPLAIETEDYAKTLGVLWYSKEDIFGFSYANEFPAKISKRIVLSELAQLFDPLGLLNPIIVLGKYFMQELWLLKLDWDESLPQNLHEKWQKYRDELHLVSEIKFPRAVADLSSALNIELHLFSDASSRAFGCSIYLRAVDEIGNISVNLIAAKSKIAPLKSISLPRLELQGAVMLAKFMDRIKQIMAINLNSVFYWTDSSIVLNRLSSHPSRWTTFVANRVTQIQDLSKICEWCKIDSQSNPADIVSRGMWPSDLKENVLWFKGPAFLRSDISNWPPQKIVTKIEGPTELEERRNHLVLTTNLNSFEDLVAKCKFANCFVKLNRVFSYIFRWINNVRLRLGGRANLPYSSSLTVTELRAGLNYILYNVQQNAFYVEIISIGTDRVIKSSKIQKLNPFIDDVSGISIMRVGGRLSKSELHFTVKHPAILPADHVFTLAYVAYLHKINSHAGPLALSAFVRQRFWILNARKVVRKVVRSCISCFKQKPRALEQLMADLPKDRVVGSIYPFQKAGMDFAGPISIHFKLRGKRPVKAYLALFVCFLTKACHIEVVSDLSTPAFICALKRFFARRGLSTDLYCDNATNFTGAARELKKLFSESVIQTNILDACAERGVNFHFIPPNSPHMGGLWESAIKVAKTMLVHHINGASLTFEELTTVVAEIEAIMNSRPMYPMSADPSDMEALTPGHFLIGKPMNCIPEPFNDDELTVSPINRWKRIQHIKQIFWRRWTKEYLTSLQERCKWRSSCENVQVGTLVMISEDNVPPNKWLLGRIEAIYPGDDGLVRVVSIRTISGTLKRNIHKICPLPIEPQK